MLDTEKLERQLEHELNEVKYWEDGQVDVETEHDLIILDLLEAHKRVSRAGMVADFLYYDCKHRELEEVNRQVHRAESELVDKIMDEVNQIIKEREEKQNGKV